VASPAGFIRLPHSARVMEMDAALARKNLCCAGFLIKKIKKKGNISTQFHFEVKFLYYYYYY
jgi:hypothetical protein